MRHEIVEKMSNEDYHAHEGLSNSRMGFLLDCPRRYYTECLDPNKPDKPEAIHFKKGRALHTATLEPELFADTYCVIPKIDKRSNAGKEAYAKALADAGNKTVLEQPDFDKVVGMAKSFHEIDWFKAKIPNGKIEQSFFWQDPETGVQLKSRPDFHDSDFWIDVKTTNNLSTFTKSVFAYGYHRQAAVGREAFLQLYKKEYKYFIFVVVEESYPYLTRSFILDDASLARGETDFRKATKDYARCLETGVWESYPNRIEQIILPPWMA